MLNKIKHFICKLLKITPCICKHECACKKAYGNKLDEGV